jgi:hypothetical protein
LTVHEGDLTVSQDGEVVENLEIRGELRITANNVVVRNVWVYTTSFWTIYVQSGSATFQDVEIGHPDFVGERGIGGDNISASNLDIHSVEDGIKIGSNVVYNGVRVHDLRSRSSSPHADAVQADGGSSNVVIKNSSLDSSGPLGNGNAAVIIKSDLGSLSNITFTNNYLNGGNYTVYVRDGGYGMPSNITFTNNRIGPNRAYGILSIDGPIVWENNVLASTGELIDIDGNEAGGGTTTTTTKPKTTTTTTTTKPKTTTTKPKTTTTKPKTTTTKPKTTTTKPKTTTTEPKTTTTEPAGGEGVETPTDTSASEAAAPTSVVTSTTTTVLPTTTTTVAEVTAPVDSDPPDAGAAVVAYGRAADADTAAGVTLALLALATVVALALSVLSIRSAGSHG